jgi:hypothetical protein
LFEEVNKGGLVGANLRRRFSVGSSSTTIKLTPLSGVLPWGVDVFLGRIERNAFAFARAENRVNFGGPYKFLSGESLRVGRRDSFFGLSIKK